MSIEEKHSSDDYSVTPDGAVVEEPALAKAIHDVFQRQYAELRKVAQGVVRDRGRNPTLGATALVSELYLKWAGSPDANLLSRANFFVTAAVAMQRILISYKRHQSAAKRGGKIGKLEFDDQINQNETDGTPPEPDESDALGQALAQLKTAETRQYQVAMLRHFLGMTNDEIAEIVECSGKTVQRDWNLAKAFLAGAMKEFRA